MKLNLLPTSVSREKTVRRAWVVMVIMSLVSIGLSLFMITTSKSELMKATADALEVKPRAEQVALTAAQADTVIANVGPFVRNVSLVRAIDAHTNVYPDFYARLTPYIPDFFRIFSMTAAPLNGGTVNVTLNGVIKNQVMYNDLMFAMLRIPGVGTVTRSPIATDWEVVPNITPVDKEGRPHKLSEPLIPDDPDARLNLYLSRGGVTGYLNQGNFGSNTDAPRLNMPEWNQVTLNFTLPGNLQVPNIRAALAQAGAAPPPTSTPVAASGAAAAGFGTPGGATAAGTDTTQKGGGARRQAAAAGAGAGN